ncbi:MAG: primase C-terminal domain-containing protein [Chloroflexi bacterium]|nr:primase C-terminal domain-containing protein [Chloroflexota bacterium]
MNDYTAPAQTVNASSNGHKPQDTTSERLIKDLGARGAFFTLMDKGSKGEDFKEGWTDLRLTADVALKHLADGGNVGLLCGAASNGHIALDLDVFKDLFVETFPRFRNCRNVYRDNDLTRIKFLVHMVDKVPLRNNISIEDSLKAGGPGHHLEILSDATTGAGANCVIAGHHKTHAQIKVGGTEILEITYDELVIIHETWTGTKFKHHPAPGTFTPAAIITGAIGQGNRTFTLFSLGGTMRRRGMSEAAILAALRIVNQEQCNPPLPDEKIVKIVAGLMKFPPADVLLAEGADDEGNAACLMQGLGANFAYTDALGWLQYTGDHWETQGAEAELQLVMVETLKARRVAAVQATPPREKIVACSKPSANNIRGCEFVFKAMATVPISDFDNHPDLLNCENGVLNLRTLELYPHDASQKFTYCLTTPYNPGADRTDLYKFLNSSVGGGQDVIAYLQEIAGYCLTGHTSEEILIYLYGPSRAGKGCLTETFLALWEALSSEVDFATFTARREVDNQNFDLAQLKAARLIIASESNKYQTLNAARIKLLTGGNDIRCAHKHKPFFSYRPAFKVLLVSNHPPRADVNDDAAWGRVRVIEFPTSYLGIEDKGLKARLRTPENLQAVLAWAAEGAARWYAAPKGLCAPEAVTLATKKHRDEQNSLTLWMNEQIEAEAEGWVSNGALHAAYTDWCKSNDFERETKRAMILFLQQAGYTVGFQKKIGGRVFKGVKGITLSV